MKTTECCLLCKKSSKAFYKDLFFLCDNCSAIFRPKNMLPGRQEEKARYEKHNDDVNDTGHQQFASPITTAVLKDHSPTDAGLDFGAGKKSVIAALLEKKQYSIKLYDPFFHDSPQLLEEKYDYIACCEVIEHFHDPEKEFYLLKKLLKPTGRLYCMTHIYNTETDFNEWYYKNDPTHVFIYQKQTLEWIKDKFKFSSMSIDNRLIQFNS